MKHVPEIKKILLHLFFWIGVWFFFAYFFSYNSSNKEYILWFSSALLPVTLIATYLYLFILIPKFLLNKKYWKFALLSFYTLVFSAYTTSVIIYLCLFLVLKFDVSGIPPMAKNFSFILILEYLVVGIVCFIYILNHNFITTSRNKELQNKILAAQVQLKDQELYYLKKQIHPHFLFNTLNTIYAFAVKKSIHTPEIILKLSNLLDYILYQVNKPNVLLKEELMHIQEYISLEKIRFHDALSIHFEIPDIPEEVSIAPMILIPFVENAFKHGKMIGGTLKIEISIKLNYPHFEFTITNSIKPEIAEKRKRGLGIGNIKKRLELLYPNNYTLMQDIKSDQYVTKLVIRNLNILKNVQIN